MTIAMGAEVERIHSMLQNLWDGPMWYGLNLKEALKGVDHRNAFRKSIPGAHNIYELVIHMHAWRQFALENLKGNNAYKVEINSEQDWPVNYEATETNWKNALTALETNQKELTGYVAKMDDSKLEETVPGKKFSWYVLLHGLIQHDIYHSAQISLLKKGENDKLIK